MRRFSVSWKLSEIKQDKDVTVFSTFSCGGGSTMGYKRAGFRVIGNVEIDPRINEMYVKNHHPAHNWCMDLRDFNALPNLPEELFRLDILDGSPPCSTFSFAGKRERTWGKEKKFREGQKEQTLDDLFFVFLDTVERLRPKVVIAENVVGLVRGKAKGYVNAIIARFAELGYDVQLFMLDAAVMDVPQARRRVFFIANRIGASKLRLEFHGEPILFGNIRSERGEPVGDGVIKDLVDRAQEGDRKTEHVLKRLTGKGGSLYSQVIVADNIVCPTITSGGAYYRFADRQKFSTEDMVHVQTFPEDYDFCGNSVQYVCGMSVPPNMMANIATEVYEQWLR